MTADPSITTEAFDIGDGASISVLTIRGAQPGPTVSVLGAVHGDELEGVAAARMLSVRASTTLVAGQLRIVAVANPLAFAARTRQTPADDANLARCFPGRVDGTVTEVIAHTLTERVIAGSDLLIDLHSAGVAYAMPLFVGCVGGDDSVAVRSKAAATEFGAPLAWLHAVMQPGRSLSAALALDIPGIYVEGGGGGALLRREVLHYVDGVERVLRSFGNLPRQQSAAAPPTRWIDGGDGDVDASSHTPVDGWCLTAVEAGDEVRPGDLIAEIIDEHAEIIERIVAPERATVMMIRRRAEVVAGDGIVMYGPPTQPRP